MLSLARIGKGKETPPKKERKEKHCQAWLGLGWCGVVVQLACGYLAYHAYPAYPAYLTDFASFYE